MNQPYLYYLSSMLFREVLNGCWIFVVIRPPVGIIQRVDSNVMPILMTLAQVKDHADHFEVGHVKMRTILGEGDVENLKLPVMFGPHSFNLDRPLEVED